MNVKWFLLFFIFLINISGSYALNNVCVNETQNCFDTVQQAINNATDGQTVVIVNSTEYNESVVVNKSITLTSNSTPLPLVFADLTRKYVMNVTVGNTTLKRLLVKYNGTSATTRAIVAHRANNITIENSTINNTGSGNDGYGVWVYFSNSSFVRNNTIYTANGTYNYGIEFYTSRDGIIANNTINATGEWGSDGVKISTAGGGGNLLANTTVVNNNIASMGWGITSYTASNNITGNNITTSGYYGNNYGIEADYNLTTITGNNITTSGYFGYNYGININSGSDDIIANNTIYTDGGSGDCCNYGILSYGEVNITINNNTIYTNGELEYNFGIYTGSEYDTIINNKVNTNGKSYDNHGIYFYGFMTNATNNIVVTNGTTRNYGLSIWSDNITVSNCTVSTNGTSNESHGIYFNGINSSVTNCNVTSHSAGSYGVHFDWGWNNHIIDSIINSTQSFDIYSDDASDSYILNSSFNKSNIGFGAASDSLLFVQYRFDVRVTNASNNPIDSANVIGNDSGSYTSINPTSNFSQATNSSGYIPQQILTEFMANRTYNATSGYMYFTNYTINASKAGYTSNVTQINLTTSQSLNLTLIIIPPCDVVVNETGICWSTIQQAINNATTWQTVAILNASKEYNESIVINKTGLTLTSNASNRPTIFSQEPKATINITSNNTIISRLNIFRNASNYPVISSRSNNSIIENNTILIKGSVSGTGIEIFPVGRNNTIFGNTINATICGIDASGGNSNNDNNFSSNIINVTRLANCMSQGGVGIGLAQGSNNIIFNNTINTTGPSDNNHGMYIDINSNNNISYNTIFTNGTDTNYGIQLPDTNYNNTIAYNNVTARNGNGINIYGPGINNTIMFNRINTTGSSTTLATEGDHTGIAIIVSSSDNNSIISNTINSNGQAHDNYGIYIASDNNSIRNNVIYTNGTYNNFGIIFDWVENNTVTNTSIFSNGTSTDYGIYILNYGENNVVIDSIINATLAPDIVDDSGSNYANTTLINSTFNKSDISFLSGSTGKVFNYYRLNVFVMDGSGNPISSATVIGNDSGTYTPSNPTSNFSQSTNLSGYITQQVLTEFMANRTYNATSGYMYFTNYTINVSKTDYTSASAPVNLTQDTLVIAVLSSTSTPPPPPPGGSTGGSPGGDGALKDLPVSISIPVNITAYLQKTTPVSINITSLASTYSLFNVSILIRGLGASWYSLDISNIPIFAANQSKIINLTITPEETGNYTINVTATNGYSSKSALSKLVVLSSSFQTTTNQTAEPEPQSQSDVTEVIKNNAIFILMPIAGVAIYFLIRYLTRMKHRRVEHIRRMV